MIIKNLQHAICDFFTITCTILVPLNTNRLTKLFSQVINLGKLCRSRLTQINHIIENNVEIKSTTI